MTAQFMIECKQTEFKVIFVCLQNLFSELT